MTVAEANRLVSFGLVVLIWLVQVIIYPTFADVAPDRFARWHAGYSRAITWIVAPLMFAQLGLVACLTIRRPGLAAGLAAAPVALAWVATFALAVPIHERLRVEGPDRARIDRLVATNWIRTAAWTLAFLASLGIA